MDSCTVPVAELLRRITVISDDGCTHVTVSFSESDGVMPDAISFEAWKDNQEFTVGYDPVESNA